MKNRKIYKEKRTAAKIARQLAKLKHPDLAVAEMAKTPYGEKPLIDGPEKAAEAFAGIKSKKQEHFAMLTLDGARRLINCHIVTVGTLTSSMVHPREVFALALEDRAASIIIAHNHPSGSLSISEQDRRVTGIIKKAGEVMNIPMDDHLIVTGDGFASVPE